jgi:hypothetical protein
MQRHDRWHTFALAVRGNYGIKNGSYKGGHAFTTSPTSGASVIETFTNKVKTLVEKNPLSGSSALVHLWTDIKKLF